ncbi:hypothetical protein HZ326_23290 [Fusarium oxysporum f. sp. albedinis]|nr:hypothetical protein HZ326_23290 [Fusarium oxysporum f. sp. albedinis]
MISRTYRGVVLRSNFGKSSQIDAILGLEDCYALAVRLVQERRCIDERALRYLRVQRLGGQASLQGLRYSNALILLLLNIQKERKKERKKKELIKKIRLLDR